jgi:hypothetical protein
VYEKFIARQPIFDEKLKLFAYELLFRSSPENCFRPQKEASSGVIVDSTMLFDLQMLTGNAKAFINVDLPRSNAGPRVSCLQTASSSRFSKPSLPLQRLFSSARISVHPATC